ncbi:phosphoribosyltransferase [Mesorhizobium jarvisii]|uniref:phosphoribosyltransferase n=1 Tax=Mesorhizobium jarvisii TaxID=1777867 RepID=UPI001F0ADE71|nr:phosphoribosyltransferase [Mesorhizobium jarvisii]MCH4561084.1 phosphoribosyltransferase [Mesorhizobium jarvisii]
MPKENIVRPDGETFEVHFLQRWPNIGDLMYLQCIRSGTCKENSAAAQHYRAKRWKYVDELAELIESAGLQYDAVVSPPSSRTDAVPYRDKLLRTGVLDLSDRFKRVDGISAGHGATVDELIAATEYAAAGDEGDISSLLFVDDSVSKGTTIAAILHHLRKAGLPLDCKIVVATAVRLPTDDTKNAAKVAVK